MSQSVCDESKKAAVITKDVELFDQGLLSCYGECPICLLPLPIDSTQQVTYSCCMKIICDGCVMAAEEAAVLSGSSDRCPYCRAPPPQNHEERLTLIQKRMNAGDAEAYNQLGCSYDYGLFGLTKDCSRAVELYTEAADRGLPKAHYSLGRSYQIGEGVERDIDKALRHYAAAAKGGHPDARFFLGCCERGQCRNDTALKHFMIAANMGEEESLFAIKEMCVENSASKDDYREALIGYREATNAMKSEQRRKALGSREQRHADFDEAIAKDKAERAVRNGH